MRPRLTPRTLGRDHDGVPVPLAALADWSRAERDAEALRHRLCDLHAERDQLHDRLRAERRAWLILVAALAVCCALLWSALPPRDAPGHHPRPPAARAASERSLL